MNVEELFLQDPWFPTPLGCGVLTATNAQYFPGFQFLTRSIGARVPVGVFDGGLTSLQQEWTRRFAMILPLPPVVMPAEVDRRWWLAWNKPVFLKHSPFERTLWLDSDCVVMNDLGPLFAAIKYGPFVTSHWDGANYPQPNSEELYRLFPVPQRMAPHESINSGVVGIGRSSDDQRLLSNWEWMVAQAAEQEEIRRLIGWYDEGCLIWAMQKTRLPQVRREAPRWNCFHYLPDQGSPQKFLENLKPHKDDVVIHAGGSPKYWNLWKEEIIDV